VNRQELFHLCLFIITSAERLRDEPEYFSSMRLLQVFGRLASLVAVESNNSFPEEICREIQQRDLQEIAREIQDGEEATALNREGRQGLIEELTVKLVREAKRRQRSARVPSEIAENHCEGGHGYADSTCRGSRQ
jgi:hypothetical protein